MALFTEGSQLLERARFTQQGQSGGSLVGFDPAWMIRKTSLDDLPISSYGSVSSSPLSSH
jgi:hypothetical protein